MLECGDCEILPVKPSPLTVKITTGFLTWCKAEVVKVTSCQMLLLKEVTSGKSLLLHMTITTHWVQSDGIHLLACKVVDKIINYWCLPCVPYG
jgi:hypothetical protein